MQPAWCETGSQQPMWRAAHRSEEPRACAWPWRLLRLGTGELGPAHKALFDELVQAEQREVSDKVTKLIIFSKYLLPPRKHWPLRQWPCVTLWKLLQNSVCGLGWGGSEEFPLISSKKQTWILWRQIWFLKSVKIQLLPSLGRYTGSSYFLFTNKKWSK